MHRSKITLLLMLLIGLLFSEAFGISRVARRMNMLEIYGGVGSINGEYDGLPNIPFVINNRRVDVKGSDIYGSSYHVGITYGQLRNRHFLVSLGFQFTDHGINDTIPLPLDTILLLPSGLDLKQYDVSINLNYLFFDLGQSSWTPYFGFGLQAGIASMTFDDFATENEANYTLGFNFGADVKVWSEGNGRSAVTLSSVNTWNLVASNDRPRYLQIGGGIKYWFRP